MSEQPVPNESLVLSYLGLRKAIGIIGILLPFVLAFGKILLDGPGIQSSISAYYYTVMGDVFVGSLCAVGVFLLSYRGYERKDDIAGDIACIFAIGVALFPTSPDINATPRETVIGAVHLFCATGFFLTLAYFSLCLFRKTSSDKPPTRMKLWRNRVYAACGYIILACLVLAAIVSFLSGDSPIKRLDPIFWLEATAIVAFGLSWFTKGEAILKDEAAV
jgi:hypothetical protein